MAKRRDELAGLDRVFAQLADATPGLHDLEAPAPVLPDGLPEPLIELYAHCDGARLFHDGVELLAARDVETDDDGRAKFALLEGEPVGLDDRGRVWRADASLDDVVCEGTRLDRWIAGVVDAIGLLYDFDGEFEDGIFDEDGELLPAIAEKQLRAQLKRDPRAPGARWRLAHALLAQDQFDPGRHELEEVVQHEPSFAWAWLDLARLSERSGELAGAVDEARAGAEAATAAGHGQAGYFWAQLARIAVLANDDVARAGAAKRATELAPGMKRDQLAGAKDSLAAGDTDSARGLMALLKAVWPRDLEVLALDREIKNTGQ
jgi:hypothetical protein|nr:hypothetical protein [Kofleriaceae bacterium]